MSPPPDACSEAREVRANAADMLAFGQALFEHAGVRPANARIVMEHLIEASAMGLHSHGLMRIPQYLAEIASGTIDPSASPAIVKTGTSRLTIDGRRGFGQVVGGAMVE